jgi:putative glutamine amidotransferase
MPPEPIRIGLTMRITSAQGYLEPRDAIAHDWAAFLRVALPETAWLALPNLGGDHIRTYCEAWGINRLILTGGDDIGATPLRDETEWTLLDWAAETGVPVLGVCRGMQIMAHRADGLLMAVQDHVATRHAVTGTITKHVNSFHACGLASCPDGFTALAQAADDTIEAMHHTRLPWEAWMWHPERESVPYDPIDIQRIRTLFL